MTDADHDLDLAVELINTYWVLANPPDRLTDTEVYRRILRETDEHALAAQLKPGDLTALQALRAQLTPVFAAETIQEAARIVDSLLREGAVLARLAVDGRTAQWHWGAGQRGMTALRARLVAALATHLIRHGVTRLGVCHAVPCTCVYVDRSRARTRRYCCDQCNDRAAATAYRRRHSRT